MNITEWWELQDSSRQRNIKIAGGLAALLFIMWMMPGKGKSEAPETISPVEVDILGDDKGAGDLQQMAGEMKVMKDEYQKMARSYDQLSRQLSNLRNSLAAATSLKENPEQLSALVDEMNKIKEDMDEMREGGQMGGAPQSGTAPVQLVLGGQDAGSDSGESGSQTLSNPFSDLTSDDPGQIVSYDPLSSVQGAISEEAKEKTGGGSGRFPFMKDGNLERPPPQIVIEEASYTKPKPARSGGSRPGQSTRDQRGEALAGPEAKSVYLPSGTLFEGVLINGMDAPTSSGAASEPYPATIRLTSLAHLPNRFKTNVKDCMVLAAGFGRLDSERVHMRTEMMSCVLVDGGIIDIPIDGYITGEDGKVGMRGIVVERTGQLLMRAALAGLGSGFSSALEPQRVSSIRTGDDAGTIEYETPETSEVLKAGAYSGASQAMENLSEYYLKRADQIFPIIEVEAMRVVTIHLTKGVALDTLDDSHHGPLAKNQSER